MSHSHDLAETVQNVVELVARRLEADACSIYLSGPNTSTLVLRATVGLSPSAVGRVRLDAGEGLVGQVAQQGKPLAVDAASDHPEFRYFPETGEERYASLLAVPLAVRNVSLGVLVVQTVEQRSFARRDIELLETCAQLIAPVVLNATLLELFVAPDEERLRFVDELAQAGIPIASGEGPSRPEHNAQLWGVSSSTGVAIGPVHLLEDPLDLRDVEYSSSGDPARERAALHHAVATARRQLDEVIEETHQQFGPEFASVFHTHIQILEDKGFLHRLDQRLAEEANALRALRSVVDEYRRLFGRIEDAYFRERGVDVEDVGRRIAAALVGLRQSGLRLPAGAILVTSMILPAHFTRLEADRIGAILSEHGGVTSHGAIFARTLEVPAVTGIAELVQLARPGELAIVDGIRGRVVLSPDAHTLDEYREEKQRFDVAVGRLDAFRLRPAETRDGRAIALTANVGLLADLPLADRHGAEGVGLFRTELFAIAHRSMPGEEEQERLYTRAAQALAPRPVTIRTLDLGGDKPLPGFGVWREDNPQLGCRSIRLSLRHEPSLRTQLRALVRANRTGNLRLLLPMISSLEELLRVREILAEICEDLVRLGDGAIREPPVGVMIEVPSAALTAATLALHCDFFSIGTNDLTQYTLAVDRSNEKIASLYKPLHPAVLALIERSSRAAHRAGIPVAVCGEMASSPLAAPLLVGLGIGELSGTPRAIPVVKETLRALDSTDLEEDARRALAAETAAEVEAIAAARLETAGLLQHPDLGESLGALVARTRRRGG